MLPSSVRRVMTAAPQSPALSSLTAATPRATAATFGLQYNARCQQRRRYSSSKPSSPNDSSPKDIPAGQVTASPAQTSKSTGDKRKRKAKDSSQATQRLPSVPSTQHLPQEALALSTFFSLHRPISVTHSFPKAITDDAFAQIFASRSRNNKVSEVISTLSQTVDDLEQPMQNLGLSSQADHSAGEASGEQMHKIDIKNADGTESSVYVQLNTMSGQFLPFRPPPLPQAGDASSGVMSAEAGLEAAAEEATEEVPQTRVYKAVFTLEETTDANGEVRIMAHSPQLIEENVRTSFLERQALRQLRREEARNQGNGMLAISVRRQRKLKMKKKKYKKLMKRTRNLRRKLDKV